MSIIHIEQLNLSLVFTVKVHLNHFVELYVLKKNKVKKCWLVHAMAAKSCCDDIIWKGECPCFFFPSFVFLLFFVCRSRCPWYRNCKALIVLLLIKSYIAQTICLVIYICVCPNIAVSNLSVYALLRCLQFFN